MVLDGLILTAQSSYQALPSPVLSKRTDQDAERESLFTMTWGGFQCLVVPFRGV